MAADNIPASPEAGRQPPRVTFVIARADNGVIGKDGKLPWHIPADLQFFKRVTLGKPVIMGRKTYQSIGKPLPRRTNIVITREAGWQAPGVVVVHDIPTAFALGYEEALRTGADEIAVIGGADIYRQTLDRVQRVYLTEVHKPFAGDTTLELDLKGWREVSREHHAAAGDTPAYSFAVYER